MKVLLSKFFLCAGLPGGKKGMNFCIQDVTWLSTSSEADTLVLAAAFTVNAARKWHLEV
jgi:hypothetical protein